MKTSKKQISPSSEERSISLPEVSLASHIRLPANGSEQKMSAISGQKCFEQFEKSVPDGSLQKMFVDSLVGAKGWFSRRCALTWRLKATKSSRFLFQLLASTHRTGGNGSGLLLTPSVTMISERSSQSMEKRKLWREANGRKTVPPGSLAEQITMILQGMSSTNALIPTPTTGPNRNSRNAVLKLGPAHLNHGVALGLAQVAELSAGILPREFSRWDQVPVHYRGMLPTPIAGIIKTVGMKPETIEKRIQSGRQEDLNTAIYRTTGRTGQLSPLFVLEMMGFPRTWLMLPFQNGEANP